MCVDILYNVTNNRLFTNCTRIDMINTDNLPIKYKVSRIIILIAEYYQIIIWESPQINFIENKL